VTTKRTVLVVEDDDDVAEAIIETLKDEGYDAQRAANGREALALLRAGPLPDLVLLDLMMPVMDGRSFLEALETAHLLPELPVVVMTAMPNPEISQPIKQLFKKPLTIEALLATVGRNLPS
jgi:CheY-like chemotaxis protein